MSTRSQRSQDLNKMMFKVTKMETGKNQMNAGEAKQAINLVAKLYASDHDFKEAFLRYAGEFDFSEKGSK